MKPDLELLVLGVPGPQGSKRHVGGGRMIESSKKVKPWRDSVAWAAREAMGGREPLDGPLCCQMIFYFARPKSTKSGAKHDRKPDLSKLIRSTEDAITDGGAWADDARVVRYIDTGKQYHQTLRGAVIRVWKDEKVTP